MNRTFCDFPCPISPKATEERSTTHNQYTSHRRIPGDSKVEILLFYTMISKTCFLEIIIIQVSYFFWKWHRIEEWLIGEVKYRGVFIENKEFSIDNMIYLFIWIYLNIILENQIDIVLVIIFYFVSILLVNSLNAFF